MKRSDFLKGLGLAGIGSVMPWRTPATHAAPPKPPGVDCILIPNETAGPYPLDLSSDASKFRQDVTEGRPGVPLTLALTVVNVNLGCAPIANARVDIWHCDKDGVYSGYVQPGSNTVGQTFMRGIQLTDANGRVEFRTIYPGWYSGRITHIHFQVFLSSVLSATSQMAFPDALNDEVYTTPLYAGRGKNTSVANNTADMVFASPPGDLQYEMLGITPNTTTGGYNGLMTIGINGPTTGLAELEPETGGQFVLQQNYPNPVTEHTTFAFSLVRTSHVRLTIHDLSGRSVAKLLDARLDEGRHSVEWDRSSDMRVARGTYVYQLEVENASGRFTQVKTLTVQ